MNGFAVFWLVIALPMWGVVYFRGGDERAAMAEIQSGRVPAIEVRVAGVSSRRIQRTVGNQRVWEEVKMVSFVTADGRHYYKGWSRELAGRTGDTHKGFVVDDRLYVPELYDEAPPTHLGFLVVGGVFFTLFWVAGRFLCKGDTTSSQHQ